MALKSVILSGNYRLEGAASGGPSVKRGPPHDDADAVRRIQKGLVALGFPMPKSFPQGPMGQPDGIFGQETYATVYSFQKREFASSWGEWDGRAGRNTLGRMDQLLPGSVPVSRPIVTLPHIFSSSSECKVTGAQPAAQNAPGKVGAQAQTIKRPGPRLR